MVPLGRIEQSIVVVRGQKVMLDADLAELCGVTTKALNQAVKRNIERFPGDFMFQLTDDEKAEVVTNCDHLRSLKFSPTPPHVFTEHGAIMAASVLNTPRAVGVSVYVVRSFVRLREMVAAGPNGLQSLDFGFGTLNFGLWTGLPGCSRRSGS